LFCVECGKEGELIGPLCLECHAKKHVHASIQEFVDVVFCAHCSSLKVGDKWEDVGSVKEAVERSLLRATAVPKDVSMEGFQVSLTEKDEKTFEAVMDAVLASHGHEFHRTLTATARIKRGVCGECSKQKGSYFEATLQLRGDARVLNRENEDKTKQRVLDRVAALRANSREVFISKIERVRGGLDFYFSTAQAARIIARDLQNIRCAEYKESTSLWGRRDGRDMYRVTFLVRLPPFDQGDVISFDSKDWYVKSMSKGLVRCIQLASGEERHMRLKDLEGCTVSCPSANLQEAVVLMEGDAEIQILDPVTMSPVDLRKPKGFARDGDKIRVVKTNLGTYLMSDGW